jgi:ABC-type multidrug transport system fused ATPase/permease subunit
LCAVGLRDLIEGLPDGLDTAIGPTTRSLSGGQVQRIGIARALARGAQLIVLDEPTSALDVESEGMIAESLAALRRDPGAMIVVIAHRPSTLRLCDRVIVLDAGNVVDQGTRDEVVNRNHYFARALQSDLA